MTCMLPSASLVHTTRHARRHCNAMAEQMDVIPAAGAKTSVSKSQIKNNSSVTDPLADNRISSAHPSVDPSKSSGQVNDSEDNYRPAEALTDSTILSVDYPAETMDLENEFESKVAAPDSMRLSLKQGTGKVQSTNASANAAGMPCAGKSVLSYAPSTSLSKEKRKTKQVCRKSVASTPSTSSAEVSRLKFLNPGKQNEDLALSWNHGSITRGFKRQHTLHIQGTGVAQTSASAAAELDRLRFINPGRQNTDLKPINWMQEGVYMTRGHRRQMELHAKLCEANSSDPPLYDSRGLLLSNMQDRCDCMRPDCPGCFLPCRRCHTTKCGPLCRIMRNFHYEKAELYI
ncbi:hypothetical protein EmuJ_000488700 [Echinococcus multilocularis]|uniref:ARF7 effector protein C-terminal domain-containing protein n=1 Tax=Echinococcus multilocularis TaxID=6211 RepID=A0A068Y3C3_ECHMU|nr:hypothetical protein EmuJ_000488700 [Echinococcus multilocularis]